MMKRDVSPLKKHIEESPKLRELRDKHRRRRVRVAALITALILTILGGFVYASRMPRIQITHVVVTGNKVIDTDDIVAHVNAKLDGRYAYLVPHRDAFLYPRKKIMTDLANTFPRFKTVSVYRTDVHTLHIAVAEVRGKALWCGVDTATLDESAQCYFTDESGKIVSLAPYYSGNVYPRFYGGVLSGHTSSALGDTFTDGATFENLLAFQVRVEKVGFQVKDIVIGTGTENSLVLDLGKGKTAPLRFLKSANLDVLAGNLSAAASNPAFAKSITTDKANLQYIDLRFTNKVYYKFSDK